MSADRHVDVLADLLGGASLSEENDLMGTDRVRENLISGNELDLHDIHEGNATPTLSSARKSEEQSIHIRDSLMTPTESLDRRIMAFSKPVSQKGLCIGLDKLPDELLLLVLGYASSKLDDAVGLSHVCTRFRSVMLSCSHIWNFEVYTYMDDRQVTAILTRSGDLPLKVNIRGTSISSIYGGSLPPAQKSNLERILSQSGRITELTFPNIFLQFAVNKLAEQLLELYRFLELPALRSLSIATFQKPLSTTNYSVLHFYASWTLPNLKHLECTNFTPLPSIAISITSCHLRYLSVFNIVALAQFLEKASSLQNLSVDFRNVYSVEDLPAEWSLLVTNTSVVSFNIYDAGDYSILRITNCIRFSNVTDMSMKICNKATLHLLFDVPLLKNLRVEGVDEFVIVSLANIFSYAPYHLENLSLMGFQRTLDLGWRENGQRPVLPLLRTLRFIECSRLDHDFLKAVGAEFRKNGVEIEKVEVTKCRRVQEQGLRDAFPNSEICWTP